MTEKSTDQSQQSVQQYDEEFVIDVHRHNPLCQYCELEGLLTPAKQQEVARSR